MRLVVFMDGTWESWADNTNVSQLCGRVPHIPRGGPGGGQDKCYIQGVGVNPWERLRGGILGLGVDTNIREGYRFLVEHHRPGDEIFLLGFSRGAFTARSLAGMITKCGLVPPEVLGDDEVFARYRDKARPGLREMTANEDDPDARTEQDKAVLAHARLERIRFIGVFDTVGSLGIPGDVGHLLSRHKYEFHDTRLSGFVDIARHAVALDENRPEFTPTLWTAVPIPIPGHTTSVQQRWFVGAHTDIGGGGPPSRKPAPLSALAREWIAREAVAAGLTVDAPPTPLTGREGESPVHDSYTAFLFGLSGLVPLRRRYWRPVNTTIGEELDPSVPRRWAADPTYRPQNPNLVPWVRSELALPHP
jgi:uncharacterized protein (DUF2235 family)